MREELIRARIRGIAATVGGPQPLTRAEIRTNIDWLFTARPDLSDRHIARLLGVANSTVSRRRRAVASPHDDEGPSTSGRFVADRAARDVAVKLFHAMEKSWEARGLGLADAVFGDRTGQRLADALGEAYGDGAAERARIFQGWIEQAARILEGGV